MSRFFGFGAPFAPMPATSHVALQAPAPPPLDDTDDESAGGLLVTP